MKDTLSSATFTQNILPNLRKRDTNSQVQPSEQHQPGPTMNQPEAQHQPGSIVSQPETQPNSTSFNINESTLREGAQHRHQVINE